MTKDWKVIISRYSGGGKALKKWPEIATYLKSKGIEFSDACTNHAGHAIELAKKAVTDGYRKIIAIGGDGAIHEILNGICQQTEVPTSEITLAIIPVGSGNDWSRLHNIPKEFDRAADVIARGKEVFQDIACVEADRDGEQVRRYMMNIGGMGLDAQICYDFDRAKAKGHISDGHYLKCLVNSFFKYRKHIFKIKVDGEEFYNGPALSVALGIGKYCGGGMMQTPGALFDDGLIDITVVGSVSKLRSLVGLKKLFSGKIYDLRGIFHSRAKHIEIAADPVSYVEVDGEIVGRSPVAVSLIPSAVKVVTNLI